MTLRAFVAPHLPTLQASYEVTAVANANSDEPRPVGPDTGFVAIPIERRASPLRDLVALGRLVRLIRQSHFAAIQSITTKAGLLAMLAGFLARVPVRVHTCTGQLWVTRRGAARWFLKLVDRVIAGLATHLLVDSPSQRDFLIAQGMVTAEKSCVLGKGSLSGVDPSRFRPDLKAGKAVRERLGMHGDAAVFLYLGRLTRDKGVLDLAAAFVHVVAAVRRARLLVVGPDEEGIRAQMKSALGPAVAYARFLDYTEHPENYMAAADVFCLPSYREGFGVTVIEAAACGVPSIGSRIYGITDAIEEGATGLLFEAGNVEELARCMVHLATDPELRRTLGSRARERVLRDFRAEFIAGELQRFFASAIGPTPR
jgi:glycosyltransferase involved in cell wall biosynthesis